MAFCHVVIKILETVYSDLLRAVWLGTIRRKNGHLTFNESLR